MIRLMGALLFLACASSQAALVTVLGDDVKFTYDDATLYGSGTAVGNSLFFSPTTFVAASDNGGMMTTSDTLSIQVEMLGAGSAMTQFAMAEQGDYLLNGAGAAVSATGMFGINSDTSAYSDSQAISAGSLTVQGALTEWSIMSMIDLADTAGWGLDTAVTLIFENVLTAQTTMPGDQALVQKKFGAFGVGVSVVSLSEPSLVYLFAAALAWVSWRSRNKPRNAK